MVMLGSTEAVDLELATTLCDGSYTGRTFGDDIHHLPSINHLHRLTGILKDLDYSCREEHLAML
jgi:hypothetical protein